MTTTQSFALKYYRTRLRLLAAFSTDRAAAKAVDLFTKPMPAERIADSVFFRTARSLKLVSGKETLAGYHWPATVPTGKQLLVVHGFSSDSRKLESYITAALEIGFDVFAFDAPAHGKSTGRRLHALNYSLALQDIMAAYGYFDAFIAHSLGGLALMLALHEIQSGKQHKVVLFAPATEGKTAADNFFQLFDLPQTVRTAFDQQVLDLTGHSFDWFSIPRLLPARHLSILWVIDENDLITPISDVLPVVAARHPNLAFYFTKGLGHSKIYKDAVVRERVVEFLQASPEN